MIHKTNDHIKVKGKYWQCICADKSTAVFAPIIKSNESRRVTYKNLFAVSNTGESDFDYQKAQLIQWNGHGIKSSGMGRINNSLLTEVDDGTLKVKTKLKGVLVFKKGQYLNYVNQEVHKP